MSFDLTKEELDKRNEECCDRLKELVPKPEVTHDSENKTTSCNWKIEWTDELARDLKRLHGIDLEEELCNIFKEELQNESISGVD